MAVKNRSKHSKPAFSIGRFTVWYAEPDWNGLPTYDVREDGRHVEAGLYLDDAIEECKRLDREARVSALRERLDSLLTDLDDDSETAIALLTAACAALRA